MRARSCSARVSLLLWTASPTFDTGTDTANHPEQPVAMDQGMMRGAEVFLSTAQLGCLTVAQWTALIKQDKVRCGGVAAPASLLCARPAQKGDTVPPSCCPPSAALCRAVPCHAVLCCAAQVWQQLADLCCHADMQPDERAFAFKTLATLLDRLESDRVTDTAGHRQNTLTAALQQQLEVSALIAGGDLPCLLSLTADELLQLRDNSIGSSSNSNSSSSGNDAPWAAQLLLAGSLQHVYFKLDRIWPAGKFTSDVAAVAFLPVCQLALAVVRFTPQLFQQQQQQQDSQQQQQQQRQRPAFFAGAAAVGQVDACHAPGIGGQVPGQVNGFNTVG